MRIAAVAVLALVLAGCSGQPGPRQDAAAGCGLVYPDGSPAACDASVFSAVELLDEAPAPSTGWLCKDDSLGDNGNRQQIWMDAQGNLGVRWDWRAAPPVGPAAMYASLYQDGADQGFVFPYQPVAFAAFPVPPRTDVPFELHVSVVQVPEVLANRVDPYDPAHWEPLPAWELVVSSWGPDPWLVVNATTPAGPVHLDLNLPAFTEAGQPMTRPRGNKLIEHDGVGYVAQVLSGGAKFPARDALQMRVNPGFCYLEDMPGPAAAGTPAPVRSSSPFAL